AGGVNVYPVTYSHLCTPVDVQGGAPTAPGHQRQLLCYKAPTSAAEPPYEKAANQTLSAAGTYGAQVLAVTGQAKEVCWPTYPDLFGRNLLANGDAEGGTGSDNGDAMPAPGWMSTDGLAVVQYGASGGFPDATTPGPDDRGVNFFAGGPAAPGTLGR